MKKSKQEVNKIRKILKSDGIPVINNPYEDRYMATKTELKFLKTKLNELLSDYIIGYHEFGEKRKYWWLVSILSTLFAKVPKGYFGIEYGVSTFRKKNWTLRDKFKAFIFRKL